MGWFKRLKDWFLGIDTDSLKTELTILQLTLDSQTLILSDLIKNNKKLEVIDKDLRSLFSITANAVENLDNKLDQSEKLANFLYEKLVEHENKIISLEDRIDEKELKELTLIATEKSTAN